MLTLLLTLLPAGRSHRVPTSTPRPPRFSSLIAQCRFGPESFGRQSPAWKSRHLRTQSINHSHHFGSFYLYRQTRSWRWKQKLKPHRNRSSLPLTISFPPLLHRLPKSVSDFFFFCSAGIGGAWTPGLPPKVPSIPQGVEKSKKRLLGATVFWGHFKVFDSMVLNLKVGFRIEFRTYTPFNLHLAKSSFCSPLATESCAMILLSTIFKGSVSFRQGNLQIVVQTQSFVGQSRCFALFPEDQVAKDIGIRVFVSKKRLLQLSLCILNHTRNPCKKSRFEVRVPTSTSFTKPQDPQFSVFVRFCGLWEKGLNWNIKNLGEWFNISGWTAWIGWSYFTNPWISQKSVTSFITTCHLLESSSILVHKTYLNLRCFKCTVICHIRSEVNLVVRNSLINIPWFRFKPFDKVFFNLLMQHVAPSIGKVWKICSPK